MSPDTTTRDLAVRVLLDDSVWSNERQLPLRKRWPGQVALRWEHLGSLDDESLLTPVSVAVLRSHIVVSDLGASRLVGYARDAATAHWQLGRPGDGPGEFRQPFLVADTDSTVIVLDLQLRRLTVVTSEGRVVTSRSSASFGAVSGVCRRADDSSWWLKLTPSGDIERDGLGLLAEGQDSLRRLTPLPLEGAVHPSGIASTAALVRATNGTCVVAPTYYAWAGIVAADGAIARFPLIEAVPTPQVTVEPTGASSRRIRMADGTVASTRHLAVTDDRAYVIARGRSSARGRLVDVYRLDPWAYEGSMAFPDQVLSLSVADSTVAVITEDPSGYHRVVVATIKPPSR
ncbi:MAG TPA: hypothetical protein PKE51_05945 [Gemmatimonadaceae bacterium]|nr:hypothetical protein [Gemmatimonadaceae bacterium]